MTDKKFESENNEQNTNNKWSNILYIDLIGNKFPSQDQVLG